MKVLFIQTGGTIDKDYPKTTKGYAFEITDPAVERILEKMNPAFSWRVVPLLRKDSMEITENDRQMIFDECKNAIEDKIVITHGTDTMIQTAQFLKALEKKTIIITGAMRPERFSNSDASFNIGTALGGLNALQNGVYIAMNGSIYPWNECSRDLKTGQFVSSRA